MKGKRHGAAMGKSRSSTRGVGKPAYIDWSAEPLGELSDAAIARKLGVTAPAVTVQRNKRGIPPYRRHGFDWDAEPLGELPDTDLAAQLGVGRHMVSYQRNKRGIASFQFQSELDRRQSA